MPGAIASLEQSLAIDLARHTRWARDGRTAEVRAEHKAQAREDRDSLKALRLERHIVAAVETAPPLSAYQRERLAEILTSTAP
jgi:hypothetical protein